MPKGMSLNHIILKKKGLSEGEKRHLMQTYANYKTPQLRSCFEPICVAMKPIEESFLNNEMKYRTGLLDFSQKVGFSSSSKERSSPNPPYLPVSKSMGGRGRKRVRSDDFVPLNKTPSNVITTQELASRGFTTPCG